MGISWYRVRLDFNYILLNRLINHIPSWTIRRYLYKRFGMHLEEKVRIGIGTIVLNPKGIYVGKRSVINEDCFLDGRGILRIGHDVSISAYSKILSASHRENSEDFQYFMNRTTIGNCTWLGTGAIVLDGSQVRDCAVIGAGAVFKGIAEEGGIFIGNPAKCIKKRRLKKNYQLEYKSYFR